MNTKIISEKISDVVALLQSFEGEAKDIAASRESLEKSTYVNTEREERLNNRAIELEQKEQDQLQQKKFLEENLERNSRILSGIQKERELLVISSTEKEQFEQDKAYLEVREKELEDGKMELEKKKALFQKTEEATKEMMQILSAREKRIQAREESLDNIERQSQIG